MSLRDIDAAALKAATDRPVIVNSFATALGYYLGGRGKAKQQGEENSLRQQQITDEQQYYQQQIAARQAELAQNQRQSDRDYGLRQSAEERAQAEAARAQTEADRTTHLWRPPDPAHGDKYGGGLWQQNQLAIKKAAQGLQAGAVDITGSQIANRNAQLTGEAQQIANQFAPLKNQLTAYAMQIDNRNAADNSPAAQHQRELETMAARDALGRATYAWERHYDQTHLGPNGGVDPTRVMTDYGGALKQLDNDQKAFNALDKTGRSVIQEPVREAYAFAEQQIAASPNPLQTANELIMSSHPGASSLRQAGLSGHLLNFAYAERLRRMLGPYGAAVKLQHDKQTGDGQPRAATPLGLELQPLPVTPGLAPLDPRPFYQRPGGGSTGAPPFPGP